MVRYNCRHCLLQVQLRPCDQLGSRMSRTTSSCRRPWGPTVLHMLAKFVAGFTCHLLLCRSCIPVRAAAYIGDKSSGHEGSVSSCCDSTLLTFAASCHDHPESWGCLSETWNQTAALWCRGEIGARVEDFNAIKNQERGLPVVARRPTKIAVPRASLPRQPREHPPIRLPRPPLLETLRTTVAIVLSQTRPKAARPLPLPPMGKLPASVKANVGAVVAAMVHRYASAPCIIYITALRPVDTSLRALYLTSSSSCYWTAVCRMHAEECWQ